VIATHFALKQSDIPTQWYNILADFPQPMAPPLHPGTKKPVTLQDMTAIFPENIVMQEMCPDRWVTIPEEVRQILSLWRPTPLLRAIGKGATAVHNLQALKWFSEAPIEVKWNFLYGFPGEDAGQEQRAEVARPRALLLVDLPYLSYHLSQEETLRNAGGMAVFGIENGKLAGPKVDGVGNGFQRKR